MKRNYKQTLEFLGLRNDDRRPNMAFVEKIRQATGMRLKDAFIINAILAEVDRVCEDLVHISDVSEMLEDIKVSIELEAESDNKSAK